MNKLYILLIFVFGCYAQSSDWSNISINYPDSLDDSTSLFYANPGEIIKSAEINSMLRAIRVMQEKMGVLGSDSLLSAGEIGMANVTQYGAVGDGTTDDYASIAAAIDSAEGKILLFPQTNGWYNISQPLYFKSNSAYFILDTIKIMDSDSSLLTTDCNLGNLPSFKVAEPEKFAVGQWIAVNDTTQVPNSRQAQRSFCARISDITDSTITMTGFAYDTMHVDSAAKAYHFQSTIILQELDNVLIDGLGLGVIDNNRYGQAKIYPKTNNDGHEQQKAGLGLCVNRSTNITIKNINIENGSLHSLGFTNVINDSSTNEGGFHNLDIHVNNVTLKYGHDKNWLIRCTKRLFADNIYALGGLYYLGEAQTWTDTTTWEDAIICYANNEDIFFNNIYINGNYRYGLGFNGSAENKYIFVNNLKALNGGRYGLYALADFQSVTNVQSYDCSVALSGSNSTFTNIYVQNDRSGMSSQYRKVLISGSQNRISNLIVEDSDYGGILSASTNTRVVGGGIYNHKGHIIERGATDETLFINFEGITQLCYDGDMEYGEQAGGNGWRGTGTEIGDTLLYQGNVVHGGDYSLYVNVNATNEGCLSYYGFGLDSGITYVIDFWLYPVEFNSAAVDTIRHLGYAQSFKVDTLLGGLVDSTWNHISYEYTADTTSVHQCIIRSTDPFGTGNLRFYLDDFRVIRKIDYHEETMPSTQDSLFVTHDLPYRPLNSDISVTPASDLEGYTYYVDPEYITDSQFLIRVVGSGRTQDFKFSWSTVKK